MDMYRMEEFVLCVSNAYEKKYYLSDRFEAIPQSVKDELKIMCVLFTEDVGGILELVFNEDEELELRTTSDEGDLLYDEIGARLKVKKLQQTKQELFESLTLFYRVLVLGKVD